MKPKLAPYNYKELSPVVLIEKKSFKEFVGSGIYVKKHPEYRLFKLYGCVENKCKYCKSTDLLCIFFMHYGSSAGKGIQYQLECRECGKYTVDGADE